MTKYDGALIALMETLLMRLGIALDDPNFQRTPMRWLNFLHEFLQPYDPEDDLTVQFQQLNEVTEPSRYGHPLVVQSKIPYQAVCAHHLVPVLGWAAIGYIPQEKVVGLSKLTRLVWGISHRTPSLQEDVGNEVVESLMEHLGALGAMCVIQAEHGCMACRGVAFQGITTSTSAIRGVFQDESHLREEFYALAGIR